MDVGFHLARKAYIRASAPRFARTHAADLGRRNPFEHALVTTAMLVAILALPNAVALASPIRLEASGLVTAMPTTSLVAGVNLGDAWSFAIVFDPTTMSDANPETPIRGRFFGLMSVNLALGDLVLTDADFDSPRRYISNINDLALYDDVVMDAISFIAARQNTAYFGLGAIYALSGGSPTMQSDALFLTAQDYQAFYDAAPSRIFQYFPLDGGASGSADVQGSVLTASFSAVGVPEPGTLALLGLGLVGLGLSRRRQHRVHPLIDPLRPR